MEIFCFDQKNKLIYATFVKNRKTLANIFTKIHFREKLCQQIFEDKICKIFRNNIIYNKNYITYYKNTTRDVLILFNQTRSPVHHIT